MRNLPRARFVPMARRRDGTAIRIFRVSGSPGGASQGLGHTLFNTFKTKRFRIRFLPGTEPFFRAFSR